MNRKILSIERQHSFLDIERYLCETKKNRVDDIRIPSNFDNDFYQELWTSFLPVNAKRNFTLPPRIIAAGEKIDGNIDGNKVEDWGFFHSIPGAVCSIIYDKVYSDDKVKISNPRDIIRKILEENNYCLEDDFSKKMTYFIFDDKDEQFKFDRSSTSFRRSNDIRSFISRIIGDFSASSSLNEFEIDSGNISRIISFIIETYQNCQNYGWKKSDDYNNPRMVQIKRHFYPNKKSLLSKQPEGTPLYEHIENDAFGDGAQTYIDISVSDFGPGIIDHFLGSVVGERYQDFNRELLLLKLIHEQTTSKSHDPHAGRGLMNALKAAVGLNAFVSLRTSDFLLSKSFATAESRGAPKLLVRTPRERCSVPGTHWKILWRLPPKA